MEERFTGSRIAIVGVGELYDAFSVNLITSNLSTNLLLLAVEIIRGPSRCPVFVYCKQVKSKMMGKAASRWGVYV